MIMSVVKEEDFIWPNKLRTAYGYDVQNNS